MRFLFARGVTIILLVGGLSVEDDEDDQGGLGVEDDEDDQGGLGVEDDEDDHHNHFILWGWTKEGIFFIKTKNAW